MNELKDALDREMPDAPPSTVDVDAVMLRERRRSRRLGTGAAGSAAVAVAGLVAGMAVLVPMGSGSSVAGQQVSVPAANPGPTTPVTVPGTRTPAGTEASTSPTSWPPPKCPPGTNMEQAAPEGQRPLPVGRGPQFTAALTGAVHAAVGSPRLADSRWGSVDQPLVFSGGPCDPKYAAYMAAAAVLAPRPSNTRLGDLTVNLEWDNQYSTDCQRTRVTGEAPALACVERTGPRGEKVMAETQRIGAQGSPVAIWHDITIIRPGGTVVWVKCGGTGPSQPNPPFTVEQLIEIGLNPGLTLS
ncbi:MAG TPA: hypothetical protein VMU51_35105 [Mycobacteriales bacterium]|nr:hypothetical protein [Mycobacteriales bacterium]